MRIAALALTLAVGPVAAQSISLPERVTTEPGLLAVVVADTECQNVKWRPLTPGLQVVAAHLLKDSRTTVVVAAKAGSYRLLAAGAKDNVPVLAETTVIVGGSRPPEDDGDGSAGFPGDPPPGPTVDDLVRSLAGTGADTLTLLSFAHWALTCAQASRGAESWEDLHSAAQALAKRGRIEGEAPKVHQAVSAYLKSRLPWSGESAYDADAAEKAFREVRDALLKAAQQARLKV